MKIGVVKETYPGETRVALIPSMLPPLVKAGFSVSVEAGAGEAAGYPDSEYETKGAQIISGHSEVLRDCDIIVGVRGYGANQDAGKDDLSSYNEKKIIIGLMEPLDNPGAVSDLAAKKVTAFALELIPRITRAQSMDVLSSMANIAGYKAVLMAADLLPKMFPMMMTAAGTISPAKVFVVGAGVAGLQAIATAKRLGAVVHAYDVRPAVKEQVESLGAKFVEMELKADNAEDKGGYAREMNEEFYRKQRELMTKVLAESDVVITTAAIPGKKAPLLITAEMVKVMAPGSVIVDLAAERGGNCELTKADKTIVEGGVSILGPVNLPAAVPYHASQMYSKNIANFLNLLAKDSKLNIDMNDQVISESLITQNGEVTNSRVKELLGLADDKQRSAD
jgi:NAD(P) transhydrogenase subunit alpha